MNSLKINLRSIQHVVNLDLDIDLTEPRIICFVGRNGTGKTTLVRALRNLSNADTFTLTATPYAFSTDSQITYTVDDVSIIYSYDENIRSLNCKVNISKEIRDLIKAELPIPFGKRFNYFKSASESDLEIRKSIALKLFNRPEELINFLTSIYKSDNYRSLVEIEFKKKFYYALVKGDGSYIREDYLSSGEYFLINLYRTIKENSKLIVIDEIDISLDAAAQANLANWLREFCKNYNRIILFTTHSLALMRQINAGELFYIDAEEGNLSITQTSYSFVKARLFGFSGWDKYILTEDQVLLEFIEEIIKTYCHSIFYKYKTLFIGGATQVINLMRFNEKENFLSSPENVISILDGDQKNEKHAKNARVLLLPIESVEKALYKEWRSDPDFPFKTKKTNFTGDKDFHNHLQQTQAASQSDIFNYLILRNKEEMEKFASIIQRFLSN